MPRNEICHFVEFLQIITAILMDFAHNKRALTQLLKAKKVCIGIIFAIYDIKEQYSMYFVSKNIHICMRYCYSKICKWVELWNIKNFIFPPFNSKLSFLLKFSIGTPSLICPLPQTMQKIFCSLNSTFP